MTMIPFEEMRTALTSLSKECQILWERNKNMQGQFTNDLAELQRYQAAIVQLETARRLGGSSDQLEPAKRTMLDMQHQAGELYQKLKDERASLVGRLGDGLRQVGSLQGGLLGGRLHDWKRRQQREQAGLKFQLMDESLDRVQAEFETLAEQNWHFRTLALWLLELLQRGPKLNDRSADHLTATLNDIVEKLTKFLFMLISQSFVVSHQPEPVLKTQHKFGAEVRLLIGDRLGVKQQLDDVSVTVKIVAEEEARMLSANELAEKDVKAVGTICNDFEKISLDDKQHMTAKFSNSKLTRIAHRKAPSKGLSFELKSQQTTTATDQKYALLFHISQFQLGSLGTFDVWTLSLPFMVIVHGSQDCDAQAVILWQRAFGSVNRSLPPEMTPPSVSWSQLSDVVRGRFGRLTGAKRPLSDLDLAYLGGKLTGDDGKMDISFNRFAKQPLRDDVSFSFWEWLFSIIQLIKQKLLTFWDEGWLVGFVGKNEASDLMCRANRSTFLLRFSDSQTGSVSIGFVCEDGDSLVPFHLSPFGIKDLDQLSLSQRITSCPQLKEIRYLYPDLDKQTMLGYFETEERNRTIRPIGYVSAEVIMVINSGVDTASVSTEADWSPGEVLFPAVDCSMNTGPADDQWDGVSGSKIDANTLLGSDFSVDVGFQPLDLGDLSSFIDDLGLPARPRPSS